MRRSTIQFKAVIVSILVLIVLLLNGCSILGRDGEEAAETAPVVYGDQAALGGEATLRCSVACMERGFCGTDPNGTTVVMLNTAGPASALNQDLLIPDNTLVTIFGIEPREAMVNATLERLTINYYFINAGQYGQGWVAGWCIAQ